MTWEHHARYLADQVTHRGSRWHGPLTATPRHLLVPRWWGWDEADEDPPLRDGPSDPDAWMAAAYSDQTLVTSVGGLHADHATPEDRPTRRPTSSSTLPSLVVRMYRHGQLYERADILDVGVGSGYGAALLARRFGDQHVTSIDVDPYLTTVAANRLDGLGLHPKIITCDATGPLPGEYDCLVAMVSVRPIPASWLMALRPGGRLVATIKNTMTIITANKNADGTATGQVEEDHAGFMTTRHGANYPPGDPNGINKIRDLDGESVERGRYPIVRLTGFGELKSMLEITAPGIQHHYEEDGDRCTAWMMHEDGSWARATASDWKALPVVHQAGPRRLWDILDDLREYWLTRGFFRLSGADVHIDPSGVAHLTRGPWRATIK